MQLSAISNRRSSQMEILAIKFASIPVLALIFIAAISYGVKSAWRGAYVKKPEKFRAEHEWKPHMINGVDYGEWVRKDGKFFGIDEFS
jgi:hypothetical protein